MAITTGQYSNVNDGGCVTTQGSTSGKHKVLISSSSTYTESTTFRVPEGDSVLLVAYHMPEGAEIVIEGISSGSRSITSGQACCTNMTNKVPPATAQAILFRSPMRLGGNIWKLTPTTDRLLISVPGEYILVLNDEQYLGDLHVELQPVPGKQQLPFEYMAGVLA